MSEVDTPMQDEAARRALKADLERFHCRVAQPDDPPLFTPSPQSSAHSIHWRWADLQPLLQRLGEQLQIGSGGQRRTLRLHNPGLPYGTTPTFWASIQVILPGEIAAAHRHTANAFRYIMTGGGATTTVDGERYPMNEGDLVLTPTMCWHDHECHASAPMVWLDVLDISLMRSMHAVRFEAGRADTQTLQAVPDASWRRYGSGLMSPPGPAPATPWGNPLLAYPRAMAEAALEQARGLPPDRHDDVVMEYRNPLNGASAMRTLGMRLSLLRPGFRGAARRHTGSKLYYVVRGSGSTTVEGTRHDWTQGDFLTIAPWHWHAHDNAGSQDAVLFQVNDFPALQALGYYFEENKEDAA